MELGKDRVPESAAVEPEDRGYGNCMERRVLAIPDDRSYIPVEPGQTAESYTAGLRKKYITVLALNRLKVAWTSYESVGNGNWEYPEKKAYEIPFTENC